MKFLHALPILIASLFACFFAPVVAQSLEVIGRFPAPPIESISENDYKKIDRKEKTIYLAQEPTSGRVIGFRKWAGTRILVYSFNDDLTPKGITVASLGFGDFKNSSLLTGYEKEGIFYILVYQQSPADANLPERERLGVLTFDLANNATNFTEVEMPQDFKFDDVTSLFDHGQAFWLLTRIRKKNTVNLYRIDGTRYANRRHLLLTDNEEKQLFDPGFSLSDLPSNRIIFTGYLYSLVPNNVFSLNISPTKDYFALYRNLPKRNGEIVAQSVYRFSIEDTTVSKVVLPPAFQSLPNSNLTQLDSLYFRTVLMPRGLHINIHRVGSPEKPFKTIKLNAGDSLSSKLIVRKQVSRAFYGREVLSDYSNPYGKFNSTFGNSILSNYCFTDYNSDIILGLSRFIQEKSSGPFSGSYNSGVKIFTLSLRLNPRTLEPFADPNGPQYNQRDSLSTAAESLPTPLSDDATSRLFLRNGNHLIVMREPNASTYRVFLGKVD